MNNGREQVEQYQQLWQPDQLGGFRIGDVVRLAGGDGTQFEIVGFNDPLAILRGPTGKEIKAGYQALVKLRFRKVKR